MSSLEAVPYNEATLTLDSKQRYPGEPLNNFSMRSAGKYFTMRKMAALAIDNIEYEWFHPNINPRNASLDILSLTNQKHRATMITGYYTLETFAPALESSLNAMTPPFAGVFTVSIGDTISGRQLSITCTNQFFPLKSNEIRDLWGVIGIDFEKDSQYTTQLIRTPKLYYTRYVDIICHQLHKFQPLRDELNNFDTSDHIARIYCNDPDSVEVFTSGDLGTGGLYTRPHFINKQIHNLKWIKWIADENLGSSLDIQVIDEFGQLAFNAEETHNFVLSLLIRG